MLQDERGQSLVEFALLTPLLLIILLGVIEFGRAIDAAHSMASLSREGANIAARGTPLDTVVAVVLANGSDLVLALSGGVVASEVRVDTGAASVTAQAHSAGFAGRSRMGRVGDRALALDSLGLIDGQTHYIVEIFHHHTAVTPLQHLLGFGVPDTLYDRAVF